MTDARGRHTESLPVFDGFWVPRDLRRMVDECTWETYLIHGGMLLDREGPCTPEIEGALRVRWPRLTPSQWASLLERLQAARMVGGREVLGRWQAALDLAMSALGQRAAHMLPVLSACTGYSAAMLATALAQGELVSPAKLSPALDFEPSWEVCRDWTGMPGLPGYARFFPERATDRLVARFRSSKPLCGAAEPTALGLGYAAGNVPGTALVIALLGALANSAAPAGVAAPSVLVRNSRHEPLFAPWVLTMIEEVDPALVAGLAVMIWDYEDEPVQAGMMRRAGLLIAAAGDDTIASLDATRSRYAPNLRFHRHGHKASFAVIDEDCLDRYSRPSDTGEPGRAVPPVDRARVAGLAALDSVLWDQNGCLSARVHFVRGDAEAFAIALVDAMRSLSDALPRGTAPRRFTHRAFDTYAGMAGDPRVRVLSTYDDDFAVVLDERPWTGPVLEATVSSCRGRVVVVRPIADLREVPVHLARLPATNLQSVSIAVPQEQVSGLAEAVGRRGVTAVRSLGRAAFPQLAYSWDGLLPLDTCRLRPPGHFTTIEFSDLAPELDATAQRWSDQLPRTRP